MAGASWYDSAWSYRAPVAVDLTASPGTPQDVTITVPPDLDEFWDNVQADGDDVRITDRDGRTLETYQLQTWTFATKTAVIEVNAAAFTDGKMNALYLYWGNAVAADASSSFTAAGAQTGTIDQGAPAWPRVIALPETPGVSRPRQRISKNSADQLYVWIDFTELLQRRISASQGSLGYEGISHLLTISITTGGTPQAGMIDATETRFIEPRIRGRRRAVAKVLVKAGADGTDYTVDVAVATTLERIITARMWLLIRDVDEA